MNASERTLAMFPTKVINPVAENQMLGAIVFS